MLPGCRSAGDVLDGELDDDALRQALTQVVQRHDALRSTFNRHGTQFIVHDRLAPHYRRVDAVTAPDTEAVLAQERLAAVTEPFDLIYGPLLRVTLVALAPRRHALVIGSHHLVCDGWSMAILLEDLSERGLLDDTLVAWTGEFGRTPKINGNAGRDHWGNVYSTVLAGGGIRGGQVYGESDRQAGEPIDHPVHVTDFVATMYHALGYGPGTIVHDAGGRPHPIVPGKPVTGLF